MLLPCIAQIVCNALKLFLVKDFHFFYRQIRQALDVLLTDMKTLPARLRQYAAFEYVQKTIKTCLKVRRHLLETVSTVHSVSLLL